VTGHVFLRHLDSDDGELEVTALPRGPIAIHSGGFQLILQANEGRALVLAGMQCMHADDDAEPFHVALLAGNALEVDATRKSVDPRLWISSEAAHLSVRYGTARALFAAISEACKWLRKHDLHAGEGGRC